MRPVKDRECSNVISKWAALHQDAHQRPVERRRNRDDVAHARCIHAIGVCILSRWAKAVIVVRRRIGPTHRRYIAAGNADEKHALDFRTLWRAVID
ncbi:hypothetical protein AB433_06510 [Croceicoccus naphthovorans]|uniref:Uncharacterized protein n=1 Tax=Croceicoccus naphthovorans TaxID=1348774 RepID=A0A0G3XGH3_9SPHN|nr:hypothetical protein AB433_06510 [Croceicoccus naphthovorans]